MNEPLLYAGAGLAIIWGHGAPLPDEKGSAGFGPISRDNRLVLTMEWIAEAILLTFAGVLITVMTVRFGAGQAQTQTSAAVSAAMLLTLAGVSAATGGRVEFIMYRLCASIFTLSAALILVSAFA